MKEPKELKIGEVFEFNISNPKGRLVLKVIYFEDNMPWCEVLEDIYEDEPEDEYDAEDRYTCGDELPYVFTGKVKLLENYV
jgi:hypothetical protein